MASQACIRNIQSTKVKMSSKITCNNCPEMAVWMYLPQSKDKPYDGFYCDGCVPRGCSCNWNPYTNEEDKDEKGRLYPCSEYFFDNEGFGFLEGKT